MVMVMSLGDGEQFTYRQHLPRQVALGDDQRNAHQYEQKTYDSAQTQCLAEQEHSENDRRDRFKNAEHSCWCRADFLNGGVRTEKRHHRRN